MARRLVVKGGESFHRWRIVAILSKSNKQKTVWSYSYGIWLGPTTHHRKRKILCNITKELEHGRILLEIFSNGMWVFMTTGTSKSQDSAQIRPAEIRTSDISCIISFLSAGWSRTGLERTSTRIIFGHLERIYYRMATIRPLDRASKSCYSLKQKLAEYAVGFYDIHNRTLIVKIQENTKKSLYYNIKFLFTIKALELRHVVFSSGSVHQYLYKT